MDQDKYLEMMLFKRVMTPKKEPIRQRLRLPKIHPAQNRVGHIRVAQGPPVSPKANENFSIFGNWEKNEEKHIYGPK